VKLEHEAWGEGHLDIVVVDWLEPRHSVDKVSVMRGVKVVAERITGVFALDNTLHHLYHWSYRLLEISAGKGSSREIVERSQQHYFLSISDEEPVLLREVSSAWWTLEHFSDQGICEQVEVQIIHGLNFLRRPMVGFSQPVADNWNYILSLGHVV
jgi:hypothetical protein